MNPEQLGITLDNIGGLPLRYLTYLQVKVEIDCTLLGERILLAGDGVVLGETDLVTYRVGELLQLLERHPTPQDVGHVHQVKKLFPGPLIYPNGLPGPLRRFWSRDEVQALWDVWSEHQRSLYLRLRTQAQLTCPTDFIAGSWAAEETQGIPQQDLDLMTPEEALQASRVGLREVRQAVTSSRFRGLSMKSWSDLVEEYQEGASLTESTAERLAYVLVLQGGGR